MKQLAIKENHLFSKAYRNGSGCSAKTVSVYVLKDRAAGRIRRADPERRLMNRVGISASKKIGGAVQRNRAKRLAREAYRLCDKEIGIKKGYLVVISCRLAADEIKLRQVREDLDFCLERLGLISKSLRS